MLKDQWAPPDLWVRAEIEEIAAMGEPLVQKVLQDLKEILVVMVCPGLLVLQDLRDHRV